MGLLCCGSFWNWPTNNSEFHSSTYSLCNVNERRDLLLIIISHPFRVLHFMATVYLNVETHVEGGQAKEEECRFG